MCISRVSLNDAFVDNTTISVWAGGLLTLNVYLSCLYELCPWRQYHYMCMVGCMAGWDNTTIRHTWVSRVSMNDDIRVKTTKSVWVGGLIQTYEYSNVPVWSGGCTNTTVSVRICVWDVWESLRNVNTLNWNLWIVCKLGVDVVPQNCITYVHKGFKTILYWSSYFS